MSVLERQMRAVFERSSLARFTQRINSLAEGLCFGLLEKAPFNVLLRQ